jgi:hypothetical protein
MHDDYADRAQRAHAEHHYGEHYMSDNTKIALGLVIGAPVLYFLLICAMSF